MPQIIKQAFTLIELLVVIAIIGILSGLIVVSMSGVTEKANIAKSQVFSNSLRNSLMLDLVSEWKFEEGIGQTVVNSWGGTNNCILGDTTAIADNDPMWITSGCVYGNCLSFDGGDYVDCGDSDSLSFGNGLTDNPFTISVWIKASLASGGIVTKSISSSTGEYYLLLSGTGIYLRLVDDSANGYIGAYCSYSPYFNNWTHVTATYDGSGLYTGIKIYINGSLQSVSSANTGTYVAMENSLVSLKIGKRDSYISGLVDDVRIFNANLPTSQIKESYYLGLNKLLNSGGITKKEYQSRVLDLNNRYGKR